jgi:hypothetical protein
MAQIIKETGIIQEVEPANGQDFTLEECQSIAGGDSEVITLDDDRLMILAEEGKIMKFPFNRLATNLARTVIRDDDYIVGDVLVCEESQFN